MFDQDDQAAAYVVHYATPSGEKSTDLKSLTELLADGTVTPETMVWLDGLADWMPLEEAQQLTSVAGGEGGGDAESSEEAGAVGRALRQSIANAPAEQQAALIDRVWARADADGNGTLDREELQAVLEQMGKVRSEISQEIDAVLAEVDTNGDGLVDYEEFKVFWLAQSAAAQDAMVAVFYADAEGEHVETTLAALQGLFDEGVVSLDTKVWMDGMDDWSPLGEQGLVG